MTDDLKTFAPDGLASFYDEPAAAARDVEIGLDRDLVHVRTPTRRRAFNALHLSNLAKALERLPAPGESWHVVARGNWAAWSLVPRVLDLTSPAKVEWLGITTLGFSRDNVDELVGMIDAGDVAKCDVIYSCYFHSNEQELVGYFEHELIRRGQRVKAIRNHSKLICMRMSDGTNIVVESSANLRSCRNVEAFVITNDAGLLDFHRQWIDQLVQGGPS